ncbi:protein pigeon isoform X1 [Aedes aegypti]|uniref:Gamma-secretase-activating protein C-terminal domain-containing protein n=1 Tax=Aedes aegypti TaxID=7159 RepID=A0A6I8T3B1_AEDAE|nr:protein pigeon isoform X1 [Aedes aegypti]XP_021702283.1 protein pigeon isoform X1 [Aedes aegypti]
MLKQENLAANFCGLLSVSGCRDVAVEWRILGKEQDGSLLAGWVSFDPKNRSEQRSKLGVYMPKHKTLQVLYTFDTKENIIQASVNLTRTLLLYTTKELRQEESGRKTDIYRTFLIEIKENVDVEPLLLLEVDRNHQMMAQFLWRNLATFEKSQQDKFLLFIHHEQVLLYTVTLKKQITDGDEDLLGSSSKLNYSDPSAWYLDKTGIKNETITKSFVWAQWDPIVQALYYIHMKPAPKTLFEKDDGSTEKKMNPTLSAFQFHDDLRTETVLNIPLNLPNIPTSSSGTEDIYEDDAVPLRIHDSSLNLIIVSDQIGMLYVCHYYLYQPIKQSDEEASTSQNICDVHFAYSVTILHHGCVIHCVIPGIPWDKAKTMKPTFTLHGDHHMLVFQADLFMHLLDVGLSHEPCCHIVCPPFTRQPVTHLVPCFATNNICYDSATLDLISITIPKNHLIEAFRNDTSIDNRLAIVHYFLAHSSGDILEIFSELLSIIMERPLHLDTVPLLKEALISGTYASSKKGLSQDQLALFRLLPLTTCNTSKPIQAKISNLTVGLSHETLYNTSMMLLSPQQRLSPFRKDIWTSLWERLNDNKERARFAQEQVTEKLMYSLTCYQPEALSRCSTPMSPANPIVNVAAEFSSASRRMQNNDVLPFVETEACTASKQELVLNVNLRELSMHLVKHSVKEVSGFRWLKNAFYDSNPAPSHVHAVATRYVAAQLEQSRALCVLVCKTAGLDLALAPERGFALVDQLTSAQQLRLFTLLERYCLAAESLAFPFPLGFSSFFTYLGYRALSFDNFMQYVEHHVFELQIDVIKVIIADIDDSAEEGVQRKLSLLMTLPRTRARRLLNNWNHPVSTMLKGREHALNILSGNSVHLRGYSQLKKREYKPKVYLCFRCIWPCCMKRNHYDRNVRHNSPFPQRSPCTYGQLNSIPLRRVPQEDNCTPPNTPSSSCELFDWHGHPSSSSSIAVPWTSNRHANRLSHTMIIVLVVLYVMAVTGIVVSSYFSIDVNFVQFVSKCYNAIRIAS